MKAYVVTYEVPYEGGSVIGLAATLKAAKKIVKKNKKAKEKRENVKINLSWPADDDTGIYVEMTNYYGHAYYIEAWEVQE